MSAPAYETIVPGNSLRLRGGFLGLANLNLVHTPDGPLLFDVGHQVNRLALVEALAARGLDPGDVPLVFLSHLHFDHCMNIDLFPRAKVLVGRREWRYAEAPHPEDAFVPWMVLEQLGKHHVELLDAEQALWPGIDLLATPGHTPGSCSLALRTADRGTVVLAGDAIKFPREALARRCDHAWDTLETGTASIERILDLADRIVPGHAPEMRRDGDGNLVWDADRAFELIVR